MIKTDDCPEINHEIPRKTSMADCNAQRVQCATVHGPWGSVPEEKKQKQTTQHKPENRTGFERIQECTGV